MPLDSPHPPSLRDRIQALIESDADITQARLARECGVHSSTLSQYLSGTYAGRVEPIEKKLAAWITHHQNRAQAITPKLPAIVETPTATRVIGTLSYAQLAGDMAVIYGAAGIGKTLACMEYQKRAPNVWIATMTPAQAGVVQCIEEIGYAIGLDAGAISGAARLHRAVCTRVRGTGGLIIVDESQHLSVSALDQVRAIHDATGIGVVLVGNETVYQRMTGGTRAAYLDRLYSRIGKRLHLRATRADLDALLSAWSVPAECLGLLHQIAGRPGALRAVGKTLRLATMQAASAGRELCLGDLRSANADLGGQP